MSVSQAEVEILLKMRAEGQQSLDLFSGTVAKSGKAAADAGDNLEEYQKRTEGVGLAGTTAAVALAGLAERMAVGLVGAFKSSIDSANQLDAALTGLSAVASGMHVNVDAAKQAAEQLASDGLMSVSEAAAGLKNLLATGFSLPEATKLMNTFRDSAAYNRQGMLGFGEAVVRATDGIKFGNSALTDSTGLGRNLSKIMTDAGRAIDDAGKAATDAGVRQAILNGFMHDGAIFSGNAAKYASSAAGAQAQWNSEITTASAKIGQELNPRLGELLGILRPIVAGIGDYAHELVPLALAIGGIVGPFAAVKAAAALGIPTFGDLVAGVVKLELAFGSGMNTAIAFKEAIGGVPSHLELLRAGLNGAAEAAGLTFANLGPLGSAAVVVGVAFASWQIGKVIGELTGLTGAVERATSSLMGYNAQLQQQTSGAVQDSINKAIRDGAAATISYAEAIKYNTAIAQIHVAQFDKSYAAQKTAIEAELQLGRVTKEQANIQLAALDGERQAADVRAKRVKFTDVLALSEKKFRDEITATGMTEAELLSNLKKNEQGFEAWAKQVNLSADTIKRLKDHLTEQNKAQTAAAAEAKKTKAALEELDSSGEGWRGTLEKMNGDVVESVKGYLKAEVSQAALARVYGLTATQVKAVAKALEEETAAAKEAAKHEKKMNDALEEMMSAGDGWEGTVANMNATMVEAIRGYLEAGVSQSALATAYGITDTQIKAINKSLIEQQKIDKVTQTSIDETADLWNQYYAIVAEKSGTATDRQIAEVDRWAEHEVAKLKDNDANWQAHYDAIQAVAAEKTAAIIRESDPLWHAWQDLNRDMRGEMASTWEQVLAGEKSWKDAALQPFVSFKDGLKRIFAAILADFQNQLLSPLLGLMHKGVANLLGGLGGGGGAAGASGGGGGLAGIFGGLLGGGGGAGGAGAEGAGGAATGFGGINMKSAGGLLALSGGMELLKAKGKLANTLAGLQTGAGIGMMFGGPMGAVIGGGIGAGAGYVKGLISGQSNDTKKDREGFAQSLGARDTTDLWSMLQEKLPPELAAELQNRATRTIGKKDTEGNQKWMDDVVAALEKYKDAQHGIATQAEDEVVPSLSEMQSAAQRYGGSLDDLGPKVKGMEVAETAKGILADFKLLEKGGADLNAVYEMSKDEINDLLKHAQETGAELPAALKPYLQEMTNAGLLTDKAGNKLEDLSSFTFSEDLPTAIGDLVGTLKDFTNAITGKGGAVDALGQLSHTQVPPIRVPYRYEREGGAPQGIAPGEPDPGTYTPGGAAKGIFADRPTLAIFGEGGESEIGGPQSFFRDVFKSLGIGANGDAGTSGGGVTLNVTVHALSADGFRDAIEDDVLPMIVDAVRANRRGTRTDLVQALGV